ncbi:MAG: cycloisomerase [Bauldia sp.]
MKISTLLASAAGVALVATVAFAQEEVPAGAGANGYASQTVQVWPAEYANQGIGVDDRYFYAVDNEEIGKYDKVTGEMVGAWIDPEGGPAIHFDSAVVVDGLLYASHSNYNGWPMTSSIEVFDTETMEHVDTHSLGIQFGSLTWIDYHDGSFWGTFANYDNAGEAVLGGAEITPYGNKLNTQVVRFDENWRVAEAWVIPPAILERFEVMSNSGGSWGPDGNLWLSGHDPAEAYVMQLPEFGSELVWLATVPLEIQGQGIAWDRSADVPTIYGIMRPDRTVIVSEVTLPATP